MSTTLPEPGFGWAREIGAPGLRNHVIAFSTNALSDRATTLAAEKVPGTLCLAPRFERGIRGGDKALQDRAIAQIVGHPNVGAALVVAHDRGAAEALRARLIEMGKPVMVRAVMQSDGMQDAIDTMAADLTKLHTCVVDTPRVLLKWSDLTVALECGGSDASSAVCSNPAIGRFVDHLVGAGGTAIVSETAEFMGGEPVVRRQSRSPQVAEVIIARIAAVERMMLEDGEDYRGVNPTQENIEAGLTTLIEKTMGAVSKIGTSTFESCLDYAQIPTGPGLHFMDTPFFSPVSLTGMVLGGAQVTLFAMGVFNPSGMPLAPTIKICGNAQTLTRWKSSIDLDTTSMLTGEIDLEDAAIRIAATIGRMAEGELSCAEHWDEGQMILPRRTGSL